MNRPQTKQIPSYAGVDNLIERMTNAVLQKLQSTQINDNTGNGNVLLPGTASAVQGSLVAEPGSRALSGSHVNTSESVNSSFRSAYHSSRNCTRVNCDCVG